MSIKHASCDQQAIVTLELFLFRHASALFRYYEDLVRLDSQWGMMRLAGLGKVVMHNLSK